MDQETCFLIDGRSSDDDELTTAGGSRLCFSLREVVAIYDAQSTTDRIERLRLATEAIFLRSEAMEWQIKQREYEAKKVGPPSL